MTERRDIKKKKQENEESKESEREVVKLDWESLVVHWAECCDSKE